MSRWRARSIHHIEGEERGQPGALVVGKRPQSKETHDESSYGDRLDRTSKTIGRIQKIKGSEMVFFPSKHSPAAAARLTEEEDGAAAASPGDGGGGPSSPASPHCPKVMMKHRRLESDVGLGSNCCRQRRGYFANGADEDEDEDDDASSGSHDPTKSTSFSSTSDEDDGQTDASDEDNTMEGYSSMPSDGISAGGDVASVTSATTSSSGSRNSLLADCVAAAEYDDMDLRTLNQLVNKLHAEELKKRGEAAARRRREGGGPTPPPIDIPSELPLHPPHFSPLQSSHRLSVSAVDSWRGPSLEVVPTEEVDLLMPLWRSQWSDDRVEWERRRASLERDHELRRSRTANDARGDSDRRRPVSPDGLHRRIRSMPNVKSAGGCDRRDSRKGHSRGASAVVSSRHYKYGRPPALPDARNPNPMVEKSSKKIHKKHARYALTAGMMLGIRESVGGATGVEAELMVGRWKQWERHWREEDEGDRGGVDGDLDYDGGSADDAQERCRVEAHLQNGSVSVSSSHEEEDDDEQDVALAVGPSLEKSGATGGTKMRSSNPFLAANTLAAECERAAKHKFPPGQFYLGSNAGSPLPHRYKFKVYAPLVFARIRALFGVEKQTFLHSICGKFNFYEFASNARSGQFFFYSHDGRYMIKTLTYSESKFLREILPHYYRHLTRHPSTFLTHFYGMYRVCMPDAGGQRLHFIIMRSVFHTEKKIDRVWDLKGSRAGRRAGEGDGVSKDLDILEEGRKLRFAYRGVRRRFLEQLKTDATFLARLGIMDYSLLLGLHDCESRTPGAGDDAGSWDSTSPMTPRECEAKGMGGSGPTRSNTPFRRCVLQRASTAGDTEVGNDGFGALEGCSGRGGRRSEGCDDCTNLAVAPEPVPPPPELSDSAWGGSLSMLKNAITPRSDSGIEGYGTRLEDGTLACREIYFCGIIDILQYYNARKLGETVIRKAAGNSGQDISCVDPETYAKRFVKFISNLVED